MIPMSLFIFDDVKVKFQSEVNEKNRANGESKISFCLIGSTGLWFILPTIALNNIITDCCHCFHDGVNLTWTSQGGKFPYNKFFNIFILAVFKFFILSIVTVWMVITVKVWMDADTLVIFGTLKIVTVCTGKAAIARVLTGVCALMRVPVVTGWMVSNDVIKSLAVFIIFINYDSMESSGTD